MKNVQNASPSVTIIVPVYNGEDTIDLCLNSLSNVVYPKDKLEIIVIDNGSTDSTLAIAARHDVIILNELSIKSSYAARNVGIKAAKGDLLAFTDADCIVTPNWLTHLTSCWDDDGIGCFAGEIEAYEPEDLIEIFSDRQGILRQSGTLTCPYLPYTQTANSAYRKTVFEQVGPFNPEMTSGGDAEMAWKMQKQLGLGIKFIPEALVYHKHRTSLDGLFMQFKKYELGKILWSEFLPDYQLPSIETRRSELRSRVDHIIKFIYGDIDRFCKNEIDLADLLAPFFRLIMALGTYSARVDNIAAPLLPSCSVKPGKSCSESNLLLDIERLKGQLLEKERIIKDHQVRAEVSDQRISDLLNSWSWRITAPLRLIFRLIFSHKCS